ncbi:MAG TPA: hypothetical protein VN364_11525 [Bellilinea sp.]|nr:hypothetical protein [Bellilinea sp.]
MNTLLKFISSLTLRLRLWKHPKYYSILEVYGYTIIDGELVQLVRRSKLKRLLMGYPEWPLSPAKTDPRATVETPDHSSFTESEAGPSFPSPEMDNVYRDNLTKIHDYLEEHPTVISKLYDRLRVEGSEDSSHPVNEECPDERDKSINRLVISSEGNQSQTGSAPIGMRVHEDGQNG